MKESIQVTLNFERETRGAVLYKNPRGNAGGVQNIYIRKEAIRDGVFPNQIVVTIEEVEDA